MNKATELFIINLIEKVYGYTVSHKRRTLY